MGKDYTSKNRALEEVLKKKDLFSNTSAPWQQKILDNLISSIITKQSDRCLDAACGIGNNIETLLYYFNKVEAFDKSTNAVKFAKDYYHAKENSVEINVGSLEAIHFNDNHFDVVICTEALEHINDVKKVVNELVRVTKPGGHIIISFQNHFNLSALLKFIFEVIFKKNWDVWGTHRHEEGYENYLTCFKVKQITRGLGCVSVKEIGADYINAWLSWLPFIYKNYKLLDKHPVLFLGRLPVLKYLGMDYFMIIKKP